MGFGYETPAVSEKISLTGYLQAWGATSTSPTPAHRSKSIRSPARATRRSTTSYSSTPASCATITLVPPSTRSWTSTNGASVSYDFDVVALTAGLHYSPNFFGNSGIGWYKQLLATVPLPFVNAANGRRR